MKYYLLVIFAFFISVNLVQAQETSSADKILKTAYAQAAKENKKVLLMFHASWCGWCRKMDSSLNDPSVKAFFDKNYVITHLTVHESPGKEKLENTGALDFLTKNGGEGQGLPYWFILDKDGKRLADSQVSPGVNSGCPANKEEVQHLVAVLQKTSSISAEQVAAVEKRFRKNE